MAQPDEPGALLMLVDEQRVFIDNNNHQFLVIHKTASGGSAQDIATFFANDPAMASTHYIVGQDGTVVQAVLEKDGAGGNCCEKGNFASFLPVGQNLNTWSVSIEHCDPDSENRTPLTDAQKQASFHLVQHICQRHNIPMRRATDDNQGGIIGHNDIDPIDRANCPGNYPWDELFSYLSSQGGASMPIPQNWKDDGTTLTAPNGHHVTLGFRAHIINAASWDAGNTPNEDEYHTEQVLLHNASVGSGQRQTFRDALLWWTSQKGVVEEPYMGLELKACYDLITAQQAQLKSQQPTPGPVDTTQVEADINAVIDALPPLFAKLLADVKKL